MHLDRQPSPTKPIPPFPLTETPPQRLKQRQFSHLLARRKLFTCRETDHDIWSFDCRCGRKDLEYSIVKVMAGEITHCGCQDDKASETSTDRNPPLPGPVNFKKLTSRELRLHYGLHFLDIAGRRFGHLVALKPTGPDIINGLARWDFKCDCGRTVNYVDTAVTSMSYTACVQCRTDISSPSLFSRCEKGYKSGALTVDRDDPDNPENVICTCTCGRADISVPERKMRYRQINFCPDCQQTRRIKDLKKGH